MDVYYGTNFWADDSIKGRAPGREIKICKEFRWGEEKGYVLSLYLCEEGILVDLCFLIDKETVDQYFGKWNEKIQKKEVSEEDYEKIEQENPFQIDFSVRAEINGVKARAEGMCAAGWQASEAASNDDMCGKLVKYYELDPVSSWKFIRMSFPWRSKSAYGLESFVLKLEAFLAPYTAGYFVTDVFRGEEEVSVIHPVSGEEYMVRLCGLESETLPEKLCRTELGIDFPPHYQMLTYQTVPGLSPEQFMIQDCAVGDRPVHREDGAENMPGQSGIAVIGGSSGPTAVFIAGKGEQVSEQRTAYSELHFEKVESIKWKMVFLVKEKDDLRLEVLS